MSNKLPVRTLGEITLAQLAGTIVGAIGTMVQQCQAFGIPPDYTLLMVEINSYLESMGATSNVYEDLLRVILCSDSLEASMRFCCLQMLLNEGVQCLVTEIFPVPYYERILQVIAGQGRGLRQLNMKGVWVKEESMCYMFEIVKRLPHLTKLTIPHIANDNLLKHIADYSRCLRQLDISGETDITEIGIEYLCYGTCRDLLTYVDIGSLGDENICHTDVALLLRYLPNLTTLQSYSFVGRSLLHILEEKDAGFQCRLSYIHDTNTSGASMDAIVRTCPRLEDIYLDSPEVGILEKLKPVRLRRIKLYKFSCYELLGLLEAGGPGSSLYHLTTIKGYGPLEINRLVRVCPNLLDLDLYMMDSLTFSGDSSFPNLQGLEILSSPIQKPSLRNFICRTTTLKRLAVDTVSFSDEDISSMVIEHDFYQLEDVWFTSAPYLSIAAVEILMDRCPELQSVGQLSGWALTPDDVTLLRGILKSCNASLVLSPASIFP
ncbi:AGAP003930-PA-like protein [Anopheles sinensis]|uniref:AGAP003930-PA-like protein n=1 Tax=Anopheles sinensis TaxID=74873 RepID=A0A084W925_ANOSI|nr:AGAP003930-PA-like protein [Anopheles sinensis]